MLHIKYFCSYYNQMIEQGVQKKQKDDQKAFRHSNHPFYSPISIVNRVSA